MQNYKTINNKITEVRISIFLSTSKSLLRSTTIIMNPATSYDEVNHLTQGCVPSVVVLKYGSDDGSGRIDMSDPVEAESDEMEHELNQSTNLSNEDRWNASFCERSPSISPPQRKPSGSGLVPLKKSPMAPVKPLRIPSPRKMVSPRRKASIKIKEGGLRKAFFRLK